MRKFLFSITTAVLACAVTVPAQAAATTIPLAWEMDEPPGATVMADPVNGFDGTIGNEVATGVMFAGATGYRFERLRPNTPPAHPEHIVRVPHDPALNPGARDFTIEARYRTTNSFGNFVQKGQAAARGGYFKIQLPQGEPSCLFRGPTGVTNAVRAQSRIDDGQWHTIRCERTTDAVALYVDGAFVGRNRGLTGAISNEEPIYIGGKGVCDQIEVTCDYFGGDIDYIRISTS